MSSDLLTIDFKNESTRPSPMMRAFLATVALADDADEGAVVNVADIINHIAEVFKVKDTIKRRRGGRWGWGEIHNKAWTDTVVACCEQMGARVDLTNGDVHGVKLIT